MLLAITAVTFILGSLLATPASPHLRGVTRVAPIATPVCSSVVSPIARCPSRPRDQSYDHPVLDSPGPDYAYDLPLHAASAQPKAELALTSGATVYTELVPSVQVFNAARPSLAAEGETAAAGVRVIGHYPEYVDLAQQTGAKYFNIPTDVWDSMSSEEQWAANVKFLDRGIAAGDTFQLATPIDEMRIPSAYADEVNYLLKNGYTFNSAGNTLVPGG